MGPAVMICQGGNGMWLSAGHNQRAGCLNIAVWCSDTLFLTQIFVAKQRAKPECGIA
jgi:hypothetical protein